MVAHAGFEPTITCSQNKCNNHSANGLLILLYYYTFKYSQEDLILLFGGEEGNRTPDTISHSVTIFPRLSLVQPDLLHIMIKLVRYIGFEPIMVLIVKGLQPSATRTPTSPLTHKYILVGISRIELEFLAYETNVLTI